LEKLRSNPQIPNWGNTHHYPLGENGVDMNGIGWLRIMIRTTRNGFTEAPGITCNNAVSSVSLHDALRARKISLFVVFWHTFLIQLITMRRLAAGCFHLLVVLQVLKNFCLAGGTQVDDYNYSADDYYYTGDDYSTADDDYYSFESGCVGDLPQSQYDALELLYTATGGKQWDMDWYGWTSWSFPSSLAAPCSDHWAWVYCGRNYDALDGCVVTGLDLSIMRLNGTLPTVSLPNLVFLSLGWNNLRGNFSAWDMSGFSSLVTLYMDDNEFSGPLPAEFCKSQWSGDLSVEGNNFWCSSGCDRISFGRNCKNTSMPLHNTMSHSPSNRIPMEARLVCVTVGAFMTVIIGYFAVQYRNFEIKYRNLPLHRQLLKGRKIEDCHVQQHIQHISRKDGIGRTLLEAYYGQPQRHLISADALYLLSELAVSSMLKCKFSAETEKQLDGTTAWALLVQQADDTSFAVVEKLLGRFEGHINELISGNDIHGRRFVDIASSRVKKELKLRLFLNRRFELGANVAEHKSASSLVMFARDHGDECCFVEPVPVALKFMKYKHQYTSEIEVRRREDFDERFVIAALDSFDPSDEKFRSAAIKKGYEKYPYCIVMPWADSTVEKVIDQRHIAGEDWDLIRSILRTLCNCLVHIHSKGVVHGDIKPNNLAIIDSCVCLIDLDACTRFGCGNDDYAGKKYSSGYLPPEMFLRDGKKIREYDVDADNKRLDVTYSTCNNITVAIHKEGYRLVKSSPSQDMWAVGILLYLMCTGFMLFPTSVAGNIDAAGAQAISSWSKESREERLSNVSDKYARNLLSLLLSEDPARRPDPTHVLSHPFLSGFSPRRLQGEAPEYDVFISYRVCSDAAVAEMLCTALQRLELRVWWDKKSLLPGQPWEEGFCVGLASSCCFVCISSKGAIFSPTKSNCDFTKLTEESGCDNVLLEWRLALELKARNMIEGIFPLLVGSPETRSDGIYFTDYFASGSHPKEFPKISVRSVETKLKMHLENQGLGLTLETDETVSDTVDRIFAHQGGFIRGEINHSMDEACDAILKMRNAIRDRSNGYDQYAFTPSARTARSPSISEKTTPNYRAVTKPVMTSRKHVDAVRVVPVDTLDFTDIS
jgi:serine/threonine protein kinase